MRILPKYLAAWAYSVKGFLVGIACDFFALFAFFAVFCLPDRDASCG